MHDDKYIDTIELFDLHLDSLIDDEVIVFNDNGDLIKIYSAIPLYPEELKYKLENGSNELIDKLNELNVQEIIDLDRINTCK